MRAKERRRRVLRVDGIMGRLDSYHSLCFMERMKLFPILERGKQGRKSSWISQEPNRKYSSDRFVF